MRFGHWQFRDSLPQFGREQKALNQYSANHAIDEPPAVSGPWVSVSQPLIGIPRARDSRRPPQWRIYTNAEHVVLKPGYPRHSLART